MSSPLFSVNPNDVLKSLIVASVVAVLTVLYGVVTNAGFDLFTADWSSILKSMANNAFITAIGVLFNSFASDEDGHLGGVI